MKKLIFAMCALAMTATTFISCEDVPAPYDLPTDDGGNGGDDTPSIEAAGTGTAADPFNVAGAVKYIEDGGSESADVYVKGIVVSVVAGSYDASYGSLKYYISDDGTSTNQFYVYNGYAGPSRTKFTSEDALKAGDEVVICGNLITYNNTKEFQTGNYLVSLNGNSTTGGGDKPSTAEATGDGSQANPFNYVAATNEASKLAQGATTDNTYYIKGKIAQIKYTFSAQYGTAAYYITDDGATNDNQFYVYGCKYFGNVKWVEGNKQINVGDDVVVCAKLTNYNGTLETSGAYLVSLNGSTGETTSKGYQVVNTISDGSYIIAAKASDAAYVVFKQLEESYNYGYAKTADATLTDGILDAEDANALTFKSVTGGYTIQDSYGRYYYMSGSYNSFNVSKDLPTSGHIWTVTFNDDKTVNITNVAMSKTIQYSSSYTSYGAYASVTNTLPYLFKK